MLIYLDLLPAFHPTEPQYFITSFFNGKIALFSKNYSNPVTTWTSPTAARNLSVFWLDEKPWSFCTVSQTGFITLWNLQRSLTVPKRTTTQVTTDTEDGAAVAIWTGVADNGNNSLLFWTRQMHPLLIFLNPHYSDTEADLSEKQTFANLDSAVANIS